MLSWQIATSSCSSPLLLIVALRAASYFSIASGNLPCSSNADAKNPLHFATLLSAPSSLLKIASAASHFSIASRGLPCSSSTTAMLKKQLATRACSSPHKFRSMFSAASCFANASSNLPCLRSRLPMFVNVIAKPASPATRSCCF